ncbi:MAG: ATP-binding cassette domain-containing protein [Oscillospiraceae bacterium]|nr:ATP-binding cassette domain-containing protein [Oscillospiraceae bacterium]
MDIQIQGLYHSFGEKQLFQNYKLCLREGGVYGLTAPSGRGKTTLLRILLGLLSPDRGSVTPKVHYSAVFQTDRLLPGQNALEQLLFVRGGGRGEREECRRFLRELLPEDSLLQPVEELSGGMQRRVAIARALWAESDCVLMDEPFTGLDEESLHRSADFILEHLQGRTLLLSTHQKELLQAYPITWVRLPEQGFIDSVLP